MADDSGAWSSSYASPPPVEISMKTQKSRSSRNWKHCDPPEPRFDSFAPVDERTISYSHCRWMRLCCDTFEAEKTRRDTFSKEIKWNNFTWNREKFETRSSSEDNSSYSIAKYSKIKEKFSLNSYNGMIWRTERKDKFPFRKARQHVYGKGKK